MAYFDFISAKERAAQENRRRERDNFFRLTDEFSRKQGQFVESLGGVIDDKNRPLLDQWLSQNQAPTAPGNPMTFNTISDIGPGANSFDPSDKWMKQAWDTYWASPLSNDGDNPFEVTGKPTSDFSPFLRAKFNKEGTEQIGIEIVPPGRSRPNTKIPRASMGVAINGMTGQPVQQSSDVGLGGNGSSPSAGNQFKTANTQTPSSNSLINQLTQPTANGAPSFTQSTTPSSNTSSTWLQQALTKPWTPPKINPYPTQPVSMTDAQRQNFVLQTGHQPNIYGGVDPPGYVNGMPTPEIQRMAHEALLRNESESVNGRVFQDLSDRPASAVSDDGQGANVAAWRSQLDALRQTPSRDSAASLLQMLQGFMPMTPTNNPSGPVDLGLASGRPSVRPGATFLDDFVGENGAINFDRLQAFGNTMEQARQTRLNGGFSHLYDNVIANDVENRQKGLPSSLSGNTATYIGAMGGPTYSIGSSSTQADNAGDTPSLLNTWQQYATSQGWPSPQQPQQQPTAAPATPPAQMSLGQVQPQPASQSASATNSWPGQRYQQPSLGGLNWSQQGQGQQQGQPNNQQPLQTGQQSMGGRYGQRRQQGLGMLGQALIA